MLTINIRAVFRPIADAPLTITRDFECHVFTFVGARDLVLHTINAAWPKHGPVTLTTL